MRITISWETHNRRYTIGVVEFLKHLNIKVTDEELKATAKKLLEQNEVHQEE
jgi:hypothetical protein